MEIGKERKRKEGLEEEAGRVSIKERQQLIMILM